MKFSESVNTNLHQLRADFPYAIREAVRGAVRYIRYLAKLVCRQMRALRRGAERLAKTSRVLCHDSTCTDGRGVCWPLEQTAVHA